MLIENNATAPLTSAEQWDAYWHRWTLNGVPLRDWSFYAYYRFVANVSTEYYRYLQRVTLNKDVRNIAEIFAPYLSDDGDANEGNISNPSAMFTLDNGYDSICTRLLERAAENNERNEFWLGRNVVGVEHNEQSNRDRFRYVVDVRDMDGSNETRQVYAKHVISTAAPMQLRCAECWSMLLQKVHVFVHRDIFSRWGAQSGACTKFCPWLPT